MRRSSTCFLKVFTAHQVVTWLYLRLKLIWIGLWLPSCVSLSQRHFIFFREHDGERGLLISDCRVLLLRNDVKVLVHHDLVQYSP